MGVIEILRKRLVELNNNRAELARQLGVTRQYLSAVLNGNYKPGPKIYEALGLEREVRFVKAK
jgi:transcriptional regulator with XRE-family HTH domain